MKYSDYIGIPFQYGGRTKTSLDCYGLVMLLYKDFKNIELPEVTSTAILSHAASLIEQESHNWKPCSIDEEGAVIIFSIKGYGAHVAYVISHDKMIHAWEGSGGVCIERISGSWKHRILGCYKYDKNN